MKADITVRESELKSAARVKKSNKKQVRRITQGRNSIGIFGVLTMEPVSDI
jgi:hypothetical protein